MDSCAWNHLSLRSSVEVCSDQARACLSPRLLSNSLPDCTLPQPRCLPAPGSVARARAQALMGDLRLQPCSVLWQPCSVEWQLFHACCSNDARTAAAAAAVKCARVDAARAVSPWRQADAASIHHTAAALVGGRSSACPNAPMQAATRQLSGRAVRAMQVATAMLRGACEGDGRCLRLTGA
jgi:hypothetical protein